MTEEEKKFRKTIFEKIEQKYTLHFRERLIVGDTITETLAGLHAGATENGIQWHDLRKDPEDLPKDENVVTVIYHDCDRHNTYTACYDIIAENWIYYNFDDGVWERLAYEVIAWCEIPQFKE